MKMIAISKVTSSDQARELAIDWQVWSAEQAMSYDELWGWQQYFTKLADRFNLRDEFVENGII
jgi:hypothetical protein